MTGLIELPNDPRAGIEVLLEAARGNLTDKGEIAHGAIHVAAYGLGLFHHHDPVVTSKTAKTAKPDDCDCPDNVDDCCKKVQEIVEAHKKGSEAKAAIDWSALIMQLLPVVLKIIDLLVKEKQVA